MVYRIKYKKSVEKDLRKLPKTQLKAIVGKIQSLASKPRPQGVKKLQGATGLYRIRHGEYRIIYSVNDTTITIVVIKVGHRREIYRGVVVK